MVYTMLLLIILLLPSFQTNTISVIHHILRQDDYTDWQQMVDNTAIWTALHHTDTNTQHPRRRRLQTIRERTRQ